MKNYSIPLSRTVLSIALCGTFLFSCSDQEEAITPPTTETSVISDEVKSQFTELGFDVSDIAKDGENYLLEGDIIITPEALKNMRSSEPTIVNNAKGEQYRTFNLVSPNLRTIRIRSLSNNFDLLRAIDRAIFNYNELGLVFNMVRVSPSSPAEITIRLVSGGEFLGIAGFPTGNGFPWNEISIDELAIEGRSADDTELTVTHEIGHCLGLRHSDWYNRSFSCPSGGSEGQENFGVGAVGILGTVVEDPESIMNSCGTILSAGFVDGEFSTFDRIALRTLYR